MPDGTGLPCVNHYPGPGSQCACRKFFVGGCDAPPFWTFTNSETQIGPQWEWMNGNEWLEARLFFPAVCKWSHKYNELIQNPDIEIEIIDNPDFNPPLDLNPFRLIVRIVHVTVAFQSEWFIVFNYGNPFLIFRDAVLIWPWSVSIPGGLNSPNAVRPTGTVTFRAEMCQPDWFDGHDPK